MKKKLLALGFTLAISSSAFAKATEVNIKVNGMVCGFCAQGITKKFTAEPSVQSIDVKLTDKQVKLVLKDNQNISDERINELLSDSGYNVEKIERN